MRIFIHKNNTDIDITEYLVSIKTISATKDDKLIGNTISKLINIEFNNASGILSNCAENTFLIDLKDEGEAPTEKFSVLDAPEKYTSKLTLTLYDSMIKFNKPYKSKLNYTKDNYPSIDEQLNEMSTMTGIIINKQGLANDILTKKAKWIDSTIIMRDYLGWIAELSGCNAMVNELNEIIFIKPFSKNHTIDIASNFDKTELISISKVVYDNGILLFEKGSNTGKTIYVDSNNSYCDDQAYIDKIFDLYNGQAFYGLDNMKIFGIDDLAIGDTITYDNLKCIVTSINRTYAGQQSTMEISGNISIKNIDGVVTKISDSIKIKRLKTIVDQGQNKLNILATDIDNNNKKLGELEISTNTIQGKINKVFDEMKKVIKSVTLVTFEYQYGIADDDKSEPIDWANTLPDIEDGKWLWSRQKLTYSNGLIDYSKALPIMLQNKGDGLGIVEITYLYQLSKSDISYGVDWSENKPKLVVGMYLWQKLKIKLNGGSFKETKPFVVGTSKTVGLDEIESNITEELKTLISQSLEGIKQEVSSLKTVVDDTTTTANENKTTINQSNDMISFIQSNITSIIDKLTGAVTKNELLEMLRFDSQGVLSIGSNQSEFSMKLSKTELGFYQGNTRISYISNNLLHIKDLRVLNSIGVGPDSNVLYLKFVDNVGWIFA